MPPAAPQTWTTRELLGCHEGGGASGLAGVLVEGAGQAEVGELQARADVVGRGSQHVGRLEIEVHHLLGVGVGQGLEHGDQVGGGGLQHLLRIGDADGGVGAQMRFDIVGADQAVRQEGVTRHHRFRHHRLRVLQVLHMPFVGIALADPRQIRSGAL